MTAAPDVEFGYFRKASGAHLGEPNIVLLECGHEIECEERVGIGPYLCLACGRGEPTQTITDESWEAWCEAKHRAEEAR